MPARKRTDEKKPAAHPPVSADAVKEELQKKYVLYQIGKQQLTTFAEEKGKLNERMAELRATVDALAKLAAAPKNEMWTSLGSGAFVMSDLKDTDNVLVAVGAGVVMKETRDKALVILKQRYQELDALDDFLIAEMKKLIAQNERLETELRKMVGE